MTLYLHGIPNFVSLYGNTFPDSLCHGAVEVREPSWLLGNPARRLAGPCSPLWGAGFSTVSFGGQHLAEGGPLFTA